MSLFTNAISRNFATINRITPCINLIQPGCREYDYFVEFLSSIENPYFPGINHNLSPSEREAHFDNLFRQKGKNLGLFISKRDSNIVGGSHATIDEGILKIEGIFVKPRFQGLGIGSALLTSVQIWGKENGARQIRIELDERLQSGIRFFNRFDRTIKHDRDEAKGIFIFTKDL